jgi:hypothetical protein
MAYINLDTMEYPRHPGDVELDPTANWHEVEESDCPVGEEGQIVYEAAPENIDGVWKQVWVCRDLTEEEIAAREIEAIKIKVFNGTALSQEEAQRLTEV